jgi:hypothetical protein
MHRFGQILDPYAGHGFDEHIQPFERLNPPNIALQITAAAPLMVCATSPEMRDTNEVQCQELTAVDFEDRAVS